MQVELALTGARTGKATAVAKPTVATGTTQVESKPAATTPSVVSASAETKATNQPAAAPAGLSLLAAYSDSSEDSN